MNKISKLLGALAVTAFLAGGCTAADAGSSAPSGPSFPDHDGWNATRTVALRDGLMSGANGFTFTQANCAAVAATSKWSYDEFYNLDSDVVAAAITGCLG